jgi:hypothetical protein
MTDCLDKACLLVHKSLLHFEAGIAHFGNERFTYEVVVKMNGCFEIKFHVNQYVFKGKPIDLLLEGMFKKTASTHVEVVALRPIVDVVVRVKVAHSDLYRTREHIFTI